MAAMRRARAEASSTCAPATRAALTTNSRGVLTLAARASGAKNSGEVTIVRTTSRILPSVRRKVAAARSTRAAGGSSATNRRQSLVEMNVAVEGWVARMWMTRRASSWPPPSILCPSTTLSPWSWMRSSKMNSGFCWRSPRIVQPVKQRATSVTSFWV